jgi:hypothetical protein
MESNINTRGPKINKEEIRASGNKISAAEKIDFHTAQQKWIDRLNLTEEELDNIRKQLPHPKYADFTLNNGNYMPTEHSLDFMIASYNAIKDETWPECYTYSDLEKLPKDIINECRYVHGFDFLIYLDQDISQERWHRFNSGFWPVWELVRYKNAVLNIKEHLVDKVVLDYAAHAGIISLMSLHVGAKFVKTTNVRPEFVALANKMLGLSDFKNKFTTEVADIHDYENNQRICQSVDTVLVYGIMSHVHDHCQILDSIVSANPETIIIDDGVPNSIIEQDIPLMEWCMEPSDYPWSGWFDNRENIAVGIPNFSWYKMYMASKNYDVAYHQRYFGSGLVFTKPVRQRDIIVFKKQQ